MCQLLGSWVVGETGAWDKVWGIDHGSQGAAVRKMWLAEPRWDKGFLCVYFCWTLIKNSMVREGAGLCKVVWLESQDTPVVRIDQKKVAEIETKGAAMPHPANRRRVEAAALGQHMWCLLWNGTP